MFAKCFPICYELQLSWHIVQGHPQSYPQAEGLKETSFIESEPTIFGGSKRSRNTQPSGLAQATDGPLKDPQNSAL